MTIKNHKQIYLFLYMRPIAEVSRFFWRGHFINPIPLVVRGALNCYTHGNEPAIRVALDFGLSSSRERVGGHWSLHDNRKGSIIEAGFESGSSASPRPHANPSSSAYPRWWDESQVLGRRRNILYNKEHRQESMWYHCIHRRDVALWNELWNAESGREEI